MSFMERSAWWVSLATLVLGIVYGTHLLQDWRVAGHVPTPDKSYIVRLSFVYVVVLIIGFIGLGIVFNRDAAEGDDERDWSVGYKAAAFGGYYLGFSLAGGIWYGLQYNNSDILMHWAILALITATFISYALRIVFYKGWL